MPSKYPFALDIDQKMLTTRIAYNGSNQAQYHGLAVPGSAESDPVWLISQIFYDGSGNATSILFAGGAADFANSWTNRASVSYS